MGGLSSEQKVLLFTLSKWTALWLGAGFIFQMVLTPMGLDAYRHPFLTFAVFASFAGLGAWHYRLKSLLPQHAPFWPQAGLALVYTGVIFALSQLFNVNAPLSPEALERILQGHIYFQIFSATTWLVKLGDILFQQVFILILLTELHRLKLGPRRMIGAFAAAFTALHFPLLAIFGIKAFVFIIPAGFAGFIFSFLIVKFRRGVLYAYLVHLGFYLALGITMRQMGW